MFRLLQRSARQTFVMMQVATVMATMHSHQQEHLQDWKTLKAKTGTAKKRMCTASGDGAAAKKTRQSVASRDGITPGDEHSHGPSAESAAEPEQPANKQTNKTQKNFLKSLAIGSIVVAADGTMWEAVVPTAGTSGRRAQHNVFKDKAGRPFPLRQTLYCWRRNCKFVALTN